MPPTRAVGRCTGSSRSRSAAVPATRTAEWFGRHIGLAVAGGPTVWRSGTADRRRRSAGFRTGQVAVRVVVPVGVVVPGGVAVAGRIAALGRVQLVAGRVVTVANGSRLRPPWSSQAPYSPLRGRSRRADVAIRDHSRPARPRRNRCARHVRGTR